MNSHLNTSRQVVTDDTRAVYINVFKYHPTQGITNMGVSHDPMQAGQPLAREPCVWDQIPPITEHTLRAQEVMRQRASEQYSQLVWDSQIEPNTSGEVLNIKRSIKSDRTRGDNSCHI